MIPLIIQIIKQMVQLKIFQFLRFGTILILQVSTPQNSQVLQVL